MTESEACFGILGKIKPYLSDDTDVSYREVAFELANQRALLVRNELNKNRTIDSDIVQDLGCVAMEPVDPAECCDVQTGCKVMRTSLKIPATIELHNKDAITRIGPANKSLRAFSRTTLEGSKWVGSGKYTTQGIYAYRDNEYIYLISKNDDHKFIDTINIKGVFENPSDTIPFVNCSTGSSCYSSDDQYPIKAWMYTYIVGQVINMFVQKYNLPVDVMNDGQDNSQTKI
jgi:hypothetical protein